MSDSDDFSQPLGSDEPALTRAQLRRARADAAQPPLSQATALADGPVPGVEPATEAHHHEHNGVNWRSIRVRVFGVVVASALSIITISLWLNGQLGLYVNPDSAWWVVSMALLALVLAVASFAVPLGDDDDEHEHAHEPPASGNRKMPARVFGALMRGAGAAIILVFIGAALVLPPQSLSTELALSRVTGAPPRMSNSAEIALATSTDASNFGIGEWSTLMATTTDPVSFVGEEVALTGFVGPGDDAAFALTRLVIVHCVIDAQAAQVPVSLPQGFELPVGSWVEVSGQIALGDGGQLFVDASQISEIDEPSDPYEY